MPGPNSLKTIQPGELPAWEDCTPADSGTPAVALRSLRRRDGLSREALGEALGIGVDKIAAMESGKLRISPDVATILARVFQTVPSVFSDDDHVTIPLEVSEIANLEKKSLLRAWREYLGLTQEALAEKIGFTRQAYAQLEAKGAKPRRGTLAKIAEAMGVQVDQLTD